jgi:hypothetical protein
MRRIVHRKVPETEAPTMVVHLWREESLLSTWEVKDWMPRLHGSEERKAVS